MEASVSETSRLESPGIQMESVHAVMSKGVSREPGIPNKCT